MGFTRQSIALGFLFLILSFNLDNSKIKTLILATIAGFFHFSGFLLSFIVFNNFSRKIFKEKKINYFIMILLIILFVLLIFFNQEKIVQKFFHFQENFTNKSSLIRNFPIILSCFLFITYKDFFKNYSKNYSFYYKLSLFGIILYFSTFLLYSVSDRLLIYIIPLTVLVFSKLLNKFRTNNLKFIYLLGLNIFFICFLFGWLIFSNSGFAWLPYDILLEPKNESFNYLIKN